MDRLPLPRDLPLPLPGDPLEFQLALVVLFAVHILFVNLMLGATLVGLYHEWRGRRDPDHDRLAHEIAATVTVNKSLAVVLGVAPLLVANVYYTLHFYSANALTGLAWIMVVPLVALAFLLTYAWEYSWDALAERKGVHMALGGGAAAIFLTVPLIFLANINLMLFPERWADVRGFLSALALPNVLPRYLHFLLASLGVTGLGLAAWFGRRSYPAAERFTTLDNDALRRHFLGLALGASALQFVAGPVVLFSLPERGLSWPLVWLLLGGATVAGFAVWRLWVEMRARRVGLGKGFAVVTILLATTIGFMVTVRHVYREASLAPHRALVAAHSEAFRTRALGASMRAAAGLLEPGETERSFSSPGQRIFTVQCNACHAVGEVRVGPPLEEMVAVYAGDPDGLIAWVRAPGRKRLDYPQMPPVRLSDADYRAVADYVLNREWDEGGA